ncbi:MAG: hypothetical protein FWE84_01260 [Firmicutes bacterium]|nr:hypothetical protein [Bacillota bacterium]
MDDKEKLLRAVLKRALGYTATEHAEEWDGEGILKKQKKTVKKVPPCLAAAKLLMEQLPVDPYEGMSDEELKEERARLLGMLSGARD